MKLLRLAVLTFTTFGISATANAKPPGTWTCEAGWEDQVCDCGCGATDPDCAAGTFEVCERSGCGAGKVPWEHAPDSCMTSACGDGWKDEAAGEVCDDGEGLNGGGCSADCKSVNAGWVCGELAEKCDPAPAEPIPEATPEQGPDASAELGPEATAETNPESVESDEPVGSGGGCSGTESAPAWAGLMALAFLVSRRLRGPIRRATR